MRECIFVPRFRKKRMEQKALNRNQQCSITAVEARRVRLWLSERNWSLKLSYALVYLNIYYGFVARKTQNDGLRAHPTLKIFQFELALRALKAASFSYNTRSESYPEVLTKKQDLDMRETFRLSHVNEIVAKLFIARMTVLGCLYR